MRQRLGNHALDLRGFLDAPIAEWLPCWLRFRRGVVMEPAQLPRNEMSARLPVHSHHVSQEMRPVPFIGFATEATNEEFPILTWIRDAISSKPTRHSVKLSDTLKLRTSLDHYTTV